jgi:hypothetical protein
VFVLPRKLGRISLNQNYKVLNFLFAKGWFSGIIILSNTGGNLAMIDRYSLPQMKSIWQDEFKFKTMLAIEILALQAYATKKIVPPQAVKRIKQKAKFNLKQIQKIEEKTQHDVVAFVTNVSQYIGSDAKYLHLGLTSSDILDTTLGAQLKAAANILIDDIEIKNPKKWDGKWHLAMYDFPIRFKKARNAFRFKLKQLGFFQFQFL